MVLPIRMNDPRIAAFRIGLGWTLSTRAQSSSSQASAVLGASLTCHWSLIQQRPVPGDGLRLLARVEQSPDPLHAMRVPRAGRLRWSDAGRNLRGSGSRGPSGAARCCSMSSNRRSDRGHGPDCGTGSRSETASRSVPLKLSTKPCLASACLARCRAIDLMLGAPLQDRVRGQLGAVVGDDHAGLAAAFDQRGQLPRHTAARDRGVGDRRKALARHIVHHIQHPEAPPAGT